MARVVLNSRGMRELLKSKGVEAALAAKARRVSLTARVSAPVDSGDYKAEIDVSTHTGRTRAQARVTAHARHSLIVESRDRVLGRALTAGK